MALLHVPALRLAQVHLQLCQAILSTKRLYHGPDVSSATVDLESAEAKAVLEGKADTFTHNWQADGTPFTLATANIALFTDKKPHELCETMGWHDDRYDPQGAQS